MAWRPNYVTDEDLKNFVGIDDAADDAQVALAVSAASRAVDNCTHRQFGKVTAPVHRYYTAQWDFNRCKWVVEIDDLMDTTGVTVSVTAGNITDYTLEPRNAAADSKPWTQLVVNITSTVKPMVKDYDVDILAPWGWSAIPDTVQQATLLQGSRFLARRGAPFGVAGSPDQGSELRLLSKVDPDVELMLADYKRWWVAA